MSDSVQPHRQQPTRLPHPWDSPGKNTGVGCHFLLPCVKVKSLSRVRLLATPWTAAHQALPSMGFSRQECWSGVPLPSPIFMLISPKSLSPSHISLLESSSLFHISTLLSLKCVEWNSPPFSLVRINKRNHYLPKPEP